MLPAVGVEIDVARPVVAQPGYRAIGFHHATSQDVAWLWREAEAYFERAGRAAGEPEAERLRRLGTNFAVMAVALLQEIARATRQLEGRG